MKRLLVLSLFTFHFSLLGLAQNEVAIYPTNWWIGMKQPKLQLMLHGDMVGSARKIAFTYPGIQLVKVNRVENKNWIFLDLAISSAAKPGTAYITVDNKKIPFEFKSRRKNENGKSRIQGVTSDDLIYLIMPDRFSNGDTANDKFAGMRERSYGRDSLKGRHGGDLRGIVNHLDYLNELGVTAIWLNPVIESDRTLESFHGYAFTNHYKIDPRFGGDTAYAAFIEASHKAGIKVIQDAVYNHVDLDHVTVTDRPMRSWLNNWNGYTNTSYKDQVLLDPYVSVLDKKLMSDGWFSGNMPDLNQKNPYVANYLIQHAIWTVEFFGIDGWRIDTYAYCDLDFMNRCNKALLDEYPQLGMFAETWVHGMTNQGFFVNNNFQNIFKSNLPGVTDFQLHFAMNDALNQNFGWTEGLSKLSLTLASDFVYKDPMKNSIFLDNHDITRFYTTVGENFSKYKMGINWLLTLRGIPEMYYGTEILMTGSTGLSDALVRKDFPGGWPGDISNKFSATGRTTLENEAFNYVKTLANFRKKSSAIKTGKTTQFVPVDGVYVYFRYDDKQTVMVVSNSNDKPVNIKMDRFVERTSGFSSFREVFSGSTFSVSTDLALPAKGSGVYELLR